MRNLLAVALLALLPLAALSQTLQTAVLDVRNMTCGLCPVTVKKSLQNVNGVSHAKVDFAAKTATVAFDADKTQPAALVKATTNAGFPSKVRQ